MRKKQIAPVDIMGAESLATCESPEASMLRMILKHYKIFRYQTLIGLMLSSQTKDPVTADAMNNLKAHGLTVDNILDTDNVTLDKLICKVGFHNRKTM